MVQACTDVMIRPPSVRENAGSTAATNDNVKPPCFAIVSSYMDNGAAFAIDGEAGAVTHGIIDVERLNH